MEQRIGKLSDNELQELVGQLYDQRRTRIDLAGKKSFPKIPMTVSLEQSKTVLFCREIRIEINPADDKKSWDCNVQLALTSECPLRKSGIRISNTQPARRSPTSRPHRNNMPFE